jgi:peptidoglycan/xylan/chitin deacetylase (PgdA/CDA1 family)
MATSEAVTTDPRERIQDEGPEHFLLERYKDDGEGSALLRAYYALRPVIPRSAQLAMRRRYAKRQARTAFPAWPYETVLLDERDRELAARIADHGGALPLVNYWPHASRFAFVLTHDVESEAGVANIPAVRAVEERFGMVSSWNFCAEEYPIADGTFEALREAGCEIGLHGIDHACKLFLTRERFQSDLPAIKRYMEEWGAVGFRSPALHRNADWMPELECLYDSSYPDTDPYEPQPGGCCSIFPFMNEGLVELPVTLVQDHTLFEILGRDTIDLWRDKAAWIAEHQGLVNVIVHPDYMLTQDRLDRYAELLEFLSGLDGGWHALPRDIAAWWKAREELSVERTPAGDYVIPGGGESGATVAWARERDGRLVIEP